MNIAAESVPRADRMIALLICKWNHAGNTGFAHTPYAALPRVRAHLSEVANHVVFCVAGR